MSDDGHARKEMIAAVFARGAPSYDRVKYFWPLGRRLVERAAILPGARVLDVACGRGAALFPAAEQAGSTGEAIGIDISAPMAEQTSVEARRRGFLNAHALQMDAEDLDFRDASFDYVLCGFALPFFPRLDQALAEFRRVLKPGGRVVASTWGDAEDPLWLWYGDLCSAYGVGVKLRTQALDTPEELRAAFEQAGFTGVEVDTEVYEQIYDDEEDWWNTMWSISGRAALEQLDEAALVRFKEEAFEMAQASKQPDGFHQQLQAHFALATKRASP